MTDTYEKAYVEILEIIKKLEQQNKDKIPTELIDFFETNKDSNYIFSLDNINSNQRISFSQKTINLLAMIELKYLADDNEKKILEKALIENEKKYQEELRQKYNPDKIFKDKEIPEETTEKDVAMVEHKESIFTIIKNWFKRTF